MAPSITLMTLSTNATGIRLPAISTVATLGTARLIGH